MARRKSKAKAFRRGGKSQPEQPSQPDRAEQFACIIRGISREDYATLVAKVKAVTDAAADLAKFEASLKNGG